MKSVARTEIKSFTKKFELRPAGATFNGDLRPVMITGNQRIANQRVNYANGNLANILSAKCTIN